MSELLAKWRELNPDQAKLSNEEILLSTWKSGEGRQYADNIEDYANKLGLGDLVAGKTTSFVRHMADAATFNLPTHMDAATEMVFDAIRGQNKNKEYKDYLQRQRMISQIAAENNPVTSFLGEMGGYIAPSSALQKLMAAKNIFRGSKLPAAMAEGGAVGGATGVSNEATKQIAAGEMDAGEIAKRGVVDAALGIGLGAGTHVGGDIVKNVIGNPLISRGQAMKNAPHQVQQILNERIGQPVSEGGLGQKGAEMARKIDMDTYGRILRQGETVSPEKGRKYLADLLNDESYSESIKQEIRKMLTDISEPDRVAKITGLLEKGDQKSIWEAVERLYGDEVQKAAHTSFKELNKAVPNRELLEEGVNKALPMNDRIGLLAKHYGQSSTDIVDAATQKVSPAIKTLSPGEAIKVAADDVPKNLHIDDLVSEYKQLYPNTPVPMKQDPISNIPPLRFLPELGLDVYAASGGGAGQAYKEAIKSGIQPTITTGKMGFTVPGTLARQGTGQLLAGKGHLSNFLADPSTAINPLSQLSSDAANWVQRQASTVMKRPDITAQRRMEQSQINPGIEKAIKGVLGPGQMYNRAAGYAEAYNREGFSPDYSPENVLKQTAKSMFNPGSVIQEGAQQMLNTGMAAKAPTTELAKSNPQQFIASIPDQKVQKMLSNAAAKGKEQYNAALYVMMNNPEYRKYLK